MGHARCSFTCLISSTTTQRPGNLCSVSTYQPHLRQEERHRKEAHPHHTCYHDCSTDLTWLQVTSMVQRGDAATETTSVLSTKPLPTAHCQRHRALHHCGDPDQFPTTGQSFVGSLSHWVQIVTGKCACKVPSPSHAKSSVCVQTIKDAIMRHGSTWISSTGATLVHSMVNMIDEFSSRTSCATSSRGADDQDQ